MSEEIDKLLTTLLESDEDDDGDLVKEMTGQSPQEWLIDAGFKPGEPGVWVKFMASEAVSVAELPQGFFSLTYYRRGPSGWVFSHRYESNGPGMMDTLGEVAKIPVQEDMEDDEDDLSDFKDILGTEDKQEIYQLIENGVLAVHASITRNDHHYVHWNTTACDLQYDWNWSDSSTEEQQTHQLAIEQRIAEKMNGLEEDINQDIRGWNKKIYREIESSHESYISDENVAESIRANEYQFDEDGSWDGEGFTYDQLRPEAQQKAREWWTENLDQNDWKHMAEPVVVEWKWLLKNKGFDDVEIAWTGFGSQGDGASFTAKSIDLRRYLTGPDPLEFPEQDREQLWEDQDEDEGFDPREVYDVNRKPIKHIATKSDYAEYEARVAEFFSREQITNLSGITDKHGNTETNDFSSRPCEMCRRPLAGGRTHASGWNPKTQQVQDYWICSDCEYYAAYGKLDDTTMMDMKDDNGPIGESDDEDFDDVKDVIPDDPAQGIPVPGGAILTKSAYQYHKEFGERAWEVYFSLPQNPKPKAWFIGILVGTEAGWHELIATPRTLSRPYATPEEVVKKMHSENTRLWAAELAGRGRRQVGEDVEDEFDTKEILGEPPPEPTFTAASSHGEIKALVDDGRVVEVTLNTPGDPDGEALKSVVRFDVSEWRKFYNFETIEPNYSIDILDLGYWLKDGTYEPPVEDWRNDFAEERHKRGQPPENG